MSIVNTGFGVFVEGADPRARALTQIGPRSRNMILTAITRFEVRDGEFTVWATDINELEAPHNGHSSSSTRIDPDLAPYLYGGFFSTVKLSEADHILNIVTQANNPPALAILGGFYLKFTATHLGSTGSAALTRQQQEWDALVYTAFHGHLRNSEFNTGFVPISRLPNPGLPSVSQGGNVTPLRRKGQQPERKKQWD
ncbi:hypothetical protein JCM1840_007377 [Sporobolomyces johnsonii]